MEDEAQAERAARLFHRLLAEIDKGREGITDVRSCLGNGRRVAFPFTMFAHDCEMLFRESLDQPDTLTLAQTRDQKRRPAPAKKAKFRVNSWTDPT